MFKSGALCSLQRATNQKMACSSCGLTEGVFGDVGCGHLLCTECAHHLRALAGFLACPRPDCAHIVPATLLSTRVHRSVGFACRRRRAP